MTSRSPVRAARRAGRGRSAALVAAAVAALALVPAPSAADQLFYDADGTGISLEYGTGTWSTTSPIWWNVTPATPEYTGWVNSTSNVANFGSLNAQGGKSYTAAAAAFTVSLGEDITLNQLTVSSNLGASRDMTVSGTASNFKLILGGTTPSILNNASSNVILDVELAGTDITKGNSGLIALARTNSYTGNTNVNAGTLRFDTTGSIGGTGRSVIVNGSGIVAAGFAGVTANLLPRVASGSQGTVAVTTAQAAEAIDFSAAGGHDLTAASLGAVGSVTYTGTFTPNGTTYRLGGSGTLTYAPVIAGANSLEAGKASGGTVILTATNTYTGATTIAASSVLQVGAGGTAGSINNTSGIANAGTLTLSRSDNVNFGVPVTGAGTLIKTGTGTTTFTTAQAYTGTTAVNQGTLTTSVAQTLTGQLAFGSANNTTTAGTFRVSAADVSVGSLLAQTNTSTATTLFVDAGRTLAVNGNVVIGTSAGASTTTALTATGGGTLTVDNAAANGLFAVGGTISGNTASQGNRAIANLSALGTLNVTLDQATGVVRVNPVSTANVGGKFSTLNLPPTANLVASRLDLGTSQQNAAAGQTNAITLGNGATSMRFDTINVGTGGRDAGSITFAGANGTLTVRNAAGTGPAALNIGTGTANTGVVADNVFDVRGHSADLLLGAVAIGTQPRSSTLTNLFGFDEGTLTMASLTVSTKGTGGSTTNGGTRDTTSTVELGGGTVNITGGVLALGAATSASGNNAAGNFNATGILNVSGGTVNIGANGSGAAITMANAIAAQTATGVVSLTGGVTTLAGDVVKVGGAGTTTATVTLDGGTLDMGSKSLGLATPIDSLNFRSGTLRNVAQINNGATPLTKTTAGTLTLAGTNAYTGGTTVSDGTLLAASASATGTGAVAVNGGTLGGTGSIAGPINVAAAAALMGGNGTAATGSLTANGGFTLADGSIVKLALGPSGTHSSVILGGGSATFDNDQAFTLIDIGAAPGLYTNVISGLASNPGTTGAWTITNPGFAGSFSYNGTGGINLNLTAVPEPATAGAFGLAAVGLLGRRRQRRG